MTCSRKSLTLILNDKGFFYIYAELLYISMHLERRSMREAIICHLLTKLSRKIGRKKTEIGMSPKLLRFVFKEN